MNEINFKQLLLSITVYWRRHSKLFPNCHVSSDALYHTMPVTPFGFIGSRKSEFLAEAQFLYSKIFFIMEWYNKRGYSIKWWCTLILFYLHRPCTPLSKVNLYVTVLGGISENNFFLHICSIDPLFIRVECKILNPFLKSKLNCFKLLALFRYSFFKRGRTGLPSVFQGTGRLLNFLGGVPTLALLYIVH